MHKRHFDWRKFIQPRDECFLLLCFFGGFYFYYLSIVCLSNNHSLVRLLHGKGAYPENLYCFLSWTCYRWYFSHMTLKKCRRQWHYVDHRVQLYKIYLLLLLYVCYVSNVLLKSVLLNLPCVFFRTNGQTSKETQQQWQTYSDRHPLTQTRWPEMTSTVKPWLTIGEQRKDEMMDQ